MLFNKEMEHLQLIDWDDIHIVAYRALQVDPLLYLSVQERVFYLNVLQPLPLGERVYLVYFIEYQQHLVPIQLRDH
jgi:hypothetical protein